MADRRTCYADELAGYHLGMQVGFTFTSVLGNLARLDCKLIAVRSSLHQPGKVGLTLGNVGVQIGQFDVVIDADTVVDVTPAS